MTALEVFETDQKDDKSATEIAKTLNDQEMGKPPGGARALASKTYNY